MRTSGRYACTRQKYACTRRPDACPRQKYACTSRKYACPERLPACSPPPDARSRARGARPYGADVVVGQVQLVSWLPARSRSPATPACRAAAPGPGRTGSRRCAARRPARRSSCRRRGRRGGPARWGGSACSPCRLTRSLGDVDGVADVPLGLDLRRVETGDGPHRRVVPGQGHDVVRVVQPGRGGADPRVGVGGEGGVAGGRAGQRDDRDGRLAGSVPVAPGVGQPEGERRRQRAAQAVAGDVDLRARRWPATTS